MFFLGVLANLPFYWPEKSQSKALMRDLWMVCINMTERAKLRHVLTGLGNDHNLILV